MDMIVHGQMSYSEVGEGETFLWNPSCGSLLETW